MTNGTKVRTNSVYFEKYNRVIYGVVENNLDTDSSVCTIVRVLHQTGNIVPEHNGQLLLMLLDDLEVLEES